MRANISSKEFMTKDGMGLGWNLGNQLEESNVSGYRKTVEECETNAGNPVATQKTFDGLKKTGVNTVQCTCGLVKFPYYGNSKGRRNC